MSSVDGGSQGTGNSDRGDSAVADAAALGNYASNSKKKKMELKQQKEKMIQEEL